MQRIEKIVYLLFIAVGRRYEMLAPTLAEQLAEGQSELTKIKKIMYHVEELLKIIKE